MGTHCRSRHRRPVGAGHRHQPAFLGHHWLTDVIFAWLLGAAGLALLITVHRLSLTVRRARGNSPNRAV